MVKSLNPQAICMLPMHSSMFIVYINKKFVKLKGKKFLKCQSNTA